MAEMKGETPAVYTMTADVECPLSPSPTPRDDNGDDDVHAAKRALEKEQQQQQLHDYEPYDHGNTNHPIEYWDAAVHLVRSTIGTGILVLPYAFHTVGLGIGVVGTLVIGLLYVSNVHALLFTEYELCKKLRTRNLTFVGVVEQAFETGPKCTRRFGPYFKSLLYMYYGVPTGNAIYLLVIADNVKNVYQHFFAVAVSPTFAVTAVVAPLVLLCLIPQLKFLVPFSILTNVFTIVNIAIILLYSLDWRAWQRNGRLVEDVGRLPNFFALMLQSLIATGIILPLKNDMRTPKAFASRFGVLNASFAALTLLFGVFGVVGYLNYGDDVRDNVLANLPVGQPVTVTVYVLYTLALCVTYTLLFYVYFDCVWTNLVRRRVAKSGHENACKYALRVAINASAYLMAVAVPNFRLFTAIVGTIGIIVEIGLPSTLQLLVLATMKVKPSVFRYCILKNLTIILIAVIMFALSLKDCVKEVFRLHGVGTK